MTGYLLLGGGICGLLVALWIRLERGRFWCLILGGLIAFGLGEVLCRLLDLGGTVHVVRTVVRAQDPTSAYFYEPGSTLTFCYPDNPRGYFDPSNEVTAHINDKGFRGRDCAFSKRGDVLRIAVVGDSFTLGMGVRDADTLPAQLEAALNRAGVSSEVLNFGASGTDTREQVDLLERYVLRFDPDLVLLVVFLNDAGQEPTMQLFNAPKLLVRPRRYSRLIDATADMVETRAVHRELVRRYTEAYEDTSPGWQAMQASVHRAATLSRERGFRLALVVYPVLIQLDDRYPFAEVHRRIGSLCSREGLPFIDLLPALKGARDRDLWVHRIDQHPNEVAHTRAASYLCGRLLEAALAGQISGGIPGT